MRIYACWLRIGFLGLIQQYFLICEFSLNIKNNYLIIRFFVRNTKFSKIFFLNALKTKISLSSGRNYDFVNQANLKHCFCQRYLRLA